MRTPDKRVVVVTGASSGIGAATARTLASAGWTPVLVARGREPLEAVAADIAQAGGSAIAEPLDASDPAAVEHMAARVRDAHGAPEAIVNCAGAGQWKFIEDTTGLEAAHMMNAPYFAAFNVTRAFMADMLSRQRGVIVHVGSPASRMPWPGCTAYTAARWALRGLHEALVQDLRGTGVHSCHVVFGEVSSNYFTNNPDSHQYIPRVARIIPVSTPETCARVIERVLRRPRREVVYPFMMRAFYWSANVMPGVVRWLAGSTGRQHTA